MLSHKPWRAEAVLMLVAALLVSLSLGLLAGQLLLRFLPEMAQQHKLFHQFLISTVSLQGIALVLTHVFLRQHGIKWKEFLGLNSPRLLRSLSMAILVAVLVVPLALLINKFSEQVLIWFDQTPIEQTSIRILKATFGLGQRICFGFAAIVLAPIVEEGLFRGIFYPIIKQSGYPLLAVAGTSLVFASIHANVMTFVPLALFALVLIWLYEKTDSLLAPMLTHSLFNAFNFSMFLISAQ